MLRKLYLIFLRYAEHNLSLDRAGGPFKDSVGRNLGWVDAITLRGNRLTVTGWTTAARIGLVLGRTRLWTIPELTQPGSDARGFTLELPFDVGNLVLHIGEEDDLVFCTFRGITQAEVIRARARLILPYARTLFGLLPVIWRWKRQGDMGAREVVKERLGLVPAACTAKMESGPILPFEVSLMGASFDRITIVLPIYNAYDVLIECLDRVAAHTDLDWYLIAIEDQSSDARVWPMLKEWAKLQGDRVILLRNDVNLGFIGTVNRGLLKALPRGVPVVVLNSDALVPQGWAKRLVAPLADLTIATVTPMSNDAEIFTVPVICQRHDLRVGEADALDRVAQTLNPISGLVDAPTGVGFCMAISPAYLAQEPLFDTAFGRGYGEETDWCQKIRARGGRNVCTPALFVEHRGGTSFGSAAKQALLERNGTKISRRYPSYDTEVQTFIRDDPGNTARLVLGLAWAAGRQDEVPVYLAHAMGGGADNYLNHCIARHLEKKHAAVVLRVGQGHRWKVELHTELGTTQGMTNEVTLVNALCAYLPKMRLIYSCGVGAHDAVELPQVLMGIARGAGRMHPIEVLFHDFYPVSPSYTLLDNEGLYRGVPVAGGPLANNSAHHYTRPGHRDATLADWQRAWGALITAAERCVVFSENSAGLITQAYPQVANSIVLEPHQLLSAVPRIAPQTQSLPVIGVLGNIGYQKGAALLQKLSRDLAHTRAARLVVIGQLDPSFPLAAPAQVHGNYEVRDLAGLVDRYGISGWLIPSIWPETFSFTTHEALATGMPVVSLDLGAQGDAVRKAAAQGAPASVLPLTNQIDSNALVHMIAVAATNG